MAIYFCESIIRIYIFIFQTLAIHAYSGRFGTFLDFEVCTFSLEAGYLA